MKPKYLELGILPTDTGDMVCFSSDDVLKMAEAAGYGDDVDAFIEDNHGLACGLNADGSYGVDKLTAVAQDGRTYDVVTIGNETAHFLRYLRENEPTFREFLDSHPRKAEVREGGEFNKEVFQELVTEYRKKILEEAK